MVTPTDVTNLSEPTLSLAANVLSNSDRPVVRIAIEGRVGSGKTALLSMIHDLLKDKINVVIENDYTKHELELEQGSDHEAALRMYAPTVLLCERLTPLTPLSLGT